VFIGALVLSVLFTHWVRRLHQNQSEDYARLLIENLNHQVFYQFNIPVAWKFEKIQLRNKAQFELMDNVVRNTLHSFKVDMVNIYNLNNIISYSFDKNLIGKGNIGGTAYQKAVSGNSSSKLIQRGSFLEIFFGFPKEVKIVTFAPLRAENPTLIFVKGKGIVFSPLKRKTDATKQAGPVLGVFEIVQDLTDDYRTIFRFQQLVVLSCTTVMGILFLVLRFVVKRGEDILARRTEEQLELKEKLNRAERLSALGELTAGISHEIRNPLGIIRSSAEHLKKKMKLYDPSNTIPDIIVEESGRLNTLITDFLNFAKPKALNLTPTRVEEVLNKNLVFLDSQIKEKQIRIEKRIDVALKPMMADQAMLYQAFLNILINAMQAIGHGGEIKIEIVSTNDAVEITFKDNGSGIPDEILTKIWDPFFTTKESGTGLGLGIVRNIITSHGGSIKLINQQESGVAVRVLLPYIKESNRGHDSNR
jgi:two-component system, NtrC family, sensor histidine kinase HydH